MIIVYNIKCLSGKSYVLKSICGTHQTRKSFHNIYAPQDIIWVHINININMGVIKKITCYFVILFASGEKVTGVVFN